VNRIKAAGSSIYISVIVYPPEHIQPEAQGERGRAGFGSNKILFGIRPVHDASFQEKIFFPLK
jgi:hypothetical protein